MTRVVKGALDQVRAGLKLGHILRHPVVTAEGFTAEVRQRLARREEHFLWSVEHLVFAHARSPYRPLFEIAGYDLPRLRHLVQEQGLDAALDQLRADGVYVGIQEFKGLAPVVRRGRTLRFHESDFTNPSGTTLLQRRSGGSRSHGIISQVSWQDFVYQTRLRRWLFEGYGFVDREMILLMTPGAGFEATLRSAAMGHSPRRWVSPVAGTHLAGPVMLAVARLVGRARLPVMEVVPPERTVELARYLRTLTAPRGVLIVGFVNAVLRLALVAEEAGIPLPPITAYVGGEPITPVKRRQLEERGLTVLPHYALAEVGFAASACPEPRQADDMHVLADRIAVRQHTRPVGPGEPVPAFLFTTLLPHARNVFINTETGDYGVLEERACGCFLERAGLRLHVHSVRSFEKLTAEGITFLGPSLEQLLEEVLPRAFGGDGRHYQLVEAEDEQGLTRLYLLASPALGPLDEEALRRTVLRELGDRHMRESYGKTIQRVWENAETVQIVRRDPLLTGAGKVLHLHRDQGVLRRALAATEGGKSS